jgi:hypothetical protein
METQQPEITIVVNQEIKDFLLETSRWGKFLAITGYVGVGLLMLMGIGFTIGFSVLSSVADLGFPIGLFGLIYVLIAVLYYFPVTYLYRFSVQIKQGLTSNDQQSVTTGFGNLKSVYKFMGIFTVVILSIYSLALVVILPVTLLFIK